VVRALTGDEPAFHRHILITPGADSASAWVEDDYHHMGVTLHHDGETITRVTADMVRAPWSTCPGAVEQLAATFTGVRLDEAATRGEKQLNCTHLHDMAVIAAGNARGTGPIRYEITVTDKVDAVRIAEITREGALALRIVERDGMIEAPAEATGKTLFQLGDWIASLDGQGQEAARLLRWGAIIAHGRAIPMEQQSDANRMPPNCFTFQESRKGKAKRVGEVVDFTTASKRPLENLRAL
jgi:hypothetical protein